MTITNNLKTQIDLPVWEWCRFCPSTPTNVSSMTTGNTLGGRYLYFQVSSLLYRYDTITDSWQSLQTTTGFNTPTIMNNNVYSSAVGHYGRAIGQGGVGNNTMELAGLSGNTLVGNKIRIIGGTGVGQEKTITAISAPIIADTGVVTTGGAQSLVDASTGIGIKQWKINRWRDYQIRCEFGTGRTQVRPILYNNANTLVWADAAHLTINPWSQPIMPISTSSTAGAQTLYTIESHIITVNSDWDVNPDNTSQFVILSGGIWNLTQGTTSAPFMSLLYYDVLADYWYGKSTQTGIKTAVFLAASDLSMERMTEAGGVIFTEAVSAGSARGITTTTTTLTPMMYANFEIRIKSGLGIGQSRTILSNTASKINITKNWDIIPNNTSTYEIWRDTGKIWIIGGNDAGMLQYSMETDQITTGKQLDNGVACHLAAKVSGQNPIPLTTITRTATGMVTAGTIAAPGSGYNIDDLLTVDAKGGVVRVTSVSSTGGVLTVSLETCGTGYTAGTNKATVPTPTGGTGCQITLAAGDIDFTELVVSAISHTYKLGESVTFSGATGTGASKFNGTYTIIGTVSSTSFSYCSVGDPGASAASFTAQATTTLVDCTKNWTADEHKGKLIQMASNALASTGQTRRIVSNTPTSITWTLAATTPASGTWRYVIEDIKPFGTERTPGGVIGGGTEGFATGGSSTTLVDSTKNWETNYWSRTTNRLVRIVEGTGVGNEIAITSNTNNTLTFATQTFSPDTTTRYIIMDTFGSATTTGTATTLTDSTKNWGVNQFAGKRLRLLAGTGQGNEYAITSNTATALTYASAATPDVSTAYAILDASPKAYGIHLDMIMGSSDSTINSRYMYAWSGTGTAEISRYNINTEHWELMSYFPQYETLTTGSMYVYDGKDRIYFTKEATNRIMYYDIIKNIVVPSTTIPYGMSTAISGNRMEIIETEDNLEYLYIMRHSGQEMWRTLLFW